MFAAADAAVSAIPPARRAALGAAAEPWVRAALERYERDGAAIQSRWLTLRVLGIATSAVLMATAVPDSLGRWRLAVAGLGALLAYGIPAEVGIQVCERTPEAAAPWLLRLLRPLEWAVAPIAAPITSLGRAVARSVPQPPRVAVTETEMEHLANEGEKDGSLEHDQSEMIRNVLDFGDLTAGSVMIPRAQVGMFELKTPIERVLKEVNLQGHSRYPVYDGDADNVVGMLHVKDLISHAAIQELKDLALADVIRRPVVFVPARQSASSVLKDMRAGRRQHIVMVIDEFGGVSGIVTLEDLVEEIVGDIRDEIDRDEAPIVDLGDGRLLVDASVSLTDLSRYLGTDLPEDGAYQSLGGLLLALNGSVPAAGDRLEQSGLEFVVREADARHVKKVEILRTPSTETVPPASSRVSAA